MNSEIEYEEFLLTNLPIISSNIPLERVHIDAFNFLLTKKTRYKFQKTSLWKNPEFIIAADKNLDYIQIISLPELYICCYYDTKNIFAYDSLNSGKLTKEMKIYLQKLFPDQNLSSVKFPAMKQQSNFIDSAVYAVAYVVSLIFDIKPNIARYEHSAMRNHLIKLYKTEIIEHFPQDRRFSIHRMLPLNVAIYRKYAALDQRERKYLFRKILKKRKIGKTFKL